MNYSNYMRGDIFFVFKEAKNVGVEMEDGRPAIIVSNNQGNYYSEMVEVVYLTSRDKKPLPTHVSITAKIPSTALCEQIHTVAKERLGDYIRSCSNEEMDEIDKALKVSLGLEDNTEPEVIKLSKFVYTGAEKETLIETRVERDTYKRLYENLLEKVMK